MGASEGQPVRSRRLGAYVRAVVTTKCPLACSYCHAEGDPQAAGQRDLGADTWIELLGAGIDVGMSKLKFVGGEPLLRADLPEITSALRRRAPHLDISVITSGVAPVARLEACFSAGLSRANLTVHGFRAADFAARGGTARAYAMRAEAIQLLLSSGRPTKLNYVYTGPSCDEDLKAFIDWAAGEPICMLGAPVAGGAFASNRCALSVLDDLSNPEMNSDVVLGALQRIDGGPWETWEEEDPNSLPAKRVRLFRGPVVEVKDRRLGEQAPWGPCRVCLRRSVCREGIVALRIDHRGRLAPCLDRSDLGVELAPILRSSGARGVQAAWGSWLRDLLPESAIEEQEAA